MDDQSIVELLTTATFQVLDRESGGAYDQTVISWFDDTRVGLRSQGEGTAQRLNLYTFW